MTPPAESARLHVTINGRVQGVGFRYFVLENANRMALTGWVRNRYDRSVEVVAEGSREVLESFLTVLQRGPSAAHVETCDYEWLSPTGEFDRFRIRMSA